MNQPLSRESVPRTDIENEPFGGQAPFEGGYDMTGPIHGASLEGEHHRILCTVEGYDRHPAM
jgi:hypothetical protein